MAIGYGVACPKPTAKVVSKLLKQRKVIALDSAAKELVRKRDREACRVCFRKSREVHERVFKSRASLWASLDNSLVLCRSCHRLVHGHAIALYGLTCNGNLAFGMSAKTAQVVFTNRPLPRHVSINA